MTFADMLARGVATDWYEGVALVRGVVTFLAETSAAAVPELHQIEISDSGNINVIGGTATAEPVRRLGQLLQATLGHTEVPVQLRLVIMQATAPAPAFGSVREFDEALAYFERPDRGSVLQALYVKAAAASPASDPASMPTLDAVAPLATADAPKAAPKTVTTRWKPGAMAVAAAAMLLLAGAATTWYARRAGASVATRNVSAIAQQASDAAGAAAFSGLSAVTERMGLGRLVPASAVSAEAPEIASTTTAKNSKRRTRTDRKFDASAGPVVVFDLDTFEEPANERPVAVSVILPSPSSLAEATPDPGRGTIFSRDSEGVSPPIDVRPQLPRALPPNVRPEQLSRLELIVSESGTVESVKLVGTPRNVHDSMFLSAAKAWQFHPALKDGRPVRFRKTVWITSE